MNKVIAILTVVLFAAFGCSQNNKKPGEGVAQTPRTQPEGMMQQMPALSAPQQAKIDDALLEIYQGVELEISDVNKNTKTRQKVPFNTPTKLDGTPLTVEVIMFYPDFYMSEAGYMTQTNEPNNVAAKVKITGAIPEFDGWFFASYPEVHPYANPDYAVILTGAVKK